MNETTFVRAIVAVLSNSTAILAICVIAWGLLRLGLELIVDAIAITRDPPVSPRLTRTNDHAH